MEINTTRPKPMYTLGEELFNAISHGLGSLLGMVGLVLMLFTSVPTGSVKGIISCTVYGLSLIVLYTMSTLYHALTHPTAKKVFRIFDHCTIYLLIAGTYTPFSLLTIGGTFGWCLFAFQWGLAILGIVLNAVNMKKFKIISMTLYILMGWSIILKISAVLVSLSTPGLLLLIGGGILYTAGLIFFGLKKKYMHSVWHLFVLGGSVLHLLCVLLYVL
ncbi:MAG: hemolysin III family protein [Clostridiales bacterium]|nr:hemolysin III family protein [Clostridiales bacterium]